MTTSEKLQLIRRREGLTQEQFAEKVGVTRQALSKWENGESLPDAVNLLSISRLFGVSIDRLLDDGADLDGPAPDSGRKKYQEIGKKFILRTVGAMMVIIPALIILIMAVYASVSSAYWIIRSDGLSGNTATIYDWSLPADGAPVSVRYYSGLWALLYQANLWWFFWLLIAVAAAGVALIFLPQLKKAAEKIRTRLKK